ncbi:MAG: PilZ domain-containing protein [Acidobacteria bacterium]|nr:PilZ domain-containing protein [Acidobacteriota bacterium]
MSAEKRRSDRLMLTVPLTIKGQDSKGVRFVADARTVILNRHGASVRTKQPLQGGQIVRIANLVGRLEADFRVVGAISPPTDQGGEWGVECVGSKENIWGIQFPPVAESMESKALLECRKCHSVALMRLSLVEVQVLETSGIISRPCVNCEVASPWGIAEKQVAMTSPPEETGMPEEVQPVSRRGGLDQRRHRRIALQLPILLRDYYGGGEITKTENISKGGFCFITDKTYHVGEGVVVICPYNPSGQNIEVRARVVRAREVEGTTRKIYGVRYESQT